MTRFILAVAATASLISVGAVALAHDGHGNGRNDNRRAITGVVSSVDAANGMFTITANGSKLPAVGKKVTVFVKRDRHDNGDQQTTTTPTTTTPADNNDQGDDNDNGDNSGSGNSGHDG